jgi:hypothetical protein
MRGSRHALAVAARIRNALRHQCHRVLTWTSCAAGLLLGVAVAVGLGASGCAKSPATSDVIPPAEHEDDPAPDFVLKDPKGQEYRLRDHIGTGLIVIQFGNFT